MTKPVYLAGPWFNDRQMEILEATKAAIDQIPIKYYSPKDEMLFTLDGPSNPMDVLMANINAIKDSFIMVCITDGKDTGTMFEAGYAFRHGIPIFYLWVDHDPGDKFNLMLGASGTVCMSYSELQTQIEEFVISGTCIREIREDITYE